MKKKKIVGLVTTNPNIYHTYKIQKKIYLEIKSKFKKFYIIDLSNFLFFKNKDKIKKKIKLPKNIIYIKPKSLSEIQHFFDDKKLIVFNNLGKTFNYFKIYLILKKLNVKLLLLLNLGDIGITETNIYSGISKLTNIKINFEKFIYKIFVFLKIFPQIEIYFHTDKNIVNKINYEIKLKSKNFFSSFFNLNILKKAILVNVRKNNHKVSNKYITFVDSNFYHPDRIKRDSKFNQYDAKNYFKKLNYLLGEVKKRFKKEIIICLHPSTNEKLYKKYLKNFKLVKNESQMIISKSCITFFHESSLIIDSLSLNKPIILLKTKFLGKFMSLRIEKYLYKYKLNFINIDLDYNQISNDVEKLIISKLVNSKYNKLNRFVTNKSILKEINNL